MALSDERESPLAPAQSSARIARIRLITGFLQGIAAWLLLRLVAPVIYNGKIEHPVSYWSDRHPMLFAAIALVTALVPVILVVEAGRMRRRVLLQYLALATVVIAALAAYDLWRDPMESFGTSVQARVWPSFQVSFCTAIGLFVVNQLLEHRERGHSVFAAYVEHFEDSWMRGFQVCVAFVFALLVWGILTLGGELFDLIHVSVVRTTVEHNWFRSPALAMAFAAAVHLTDVRPALLRGVRNVGLTLLSWLLPLVVALGASFLLTLLFVGLKPLWATRHAASILLWACAITLFLLNAAYKDGDPRNVPPAVLRWTGRLAGPTMLFLTLIAAYSILLRVRQYGYTPDRVLSVAVAALALVYSAGYTYASLRRGPWLAPVQVVNVGASFALIAVLLLLRSPVADPDRVSASSQMHRLAGGHVPPAKFDYQFLRFDSGRFGTRALAQLAQDRNLEVASRARRMQQASARRYSVRDAEDSSATDAPLSHATVYPAGTQLPKDFMPANAPEEPLYAHDCLHDGTTCDIYVIAYGSPGETAVMVRSYTMDSAENAYSAATLFSRLYQRDVAGKWVQTGSFNLTNCPIVIAALREGKVASVRPAHDDLEVAGMRLEFSRRGGHEECRPVPKTPEPPAPHDATGPPHMGPAFGGQ